MKYNEEFYTKLSKSISKNEDDKCRKAIEKVVEAMKESGWTRVDKKVNYEFVGESKTAYKTTLKIHDKQARIIIQGSYANGTNVRKESDVDIAVILTSTFIPKYREGITREDYGFIKATYGLEEFRQDLFKNLNKYLPNKVEKKCKSIKIEESTTTVPTDVIPALQRRDYTRDYNYDETNFVGGILIKDFCDDYEIVNFPEQHITEGINKNGNTLRRYKKLVRIFKQLKIKAISNGYDLTDETSSFLIESMVFNVPDDIFKGTQSLKQITEDIIKYWNGIQKNMEGTFKEANNIKKLFSNESRKNGKNKYLSVLSAWLEVKNE
jgi:predicted nucleotidyltransferase